MTVSISSIKGPNLTLLLWDKHFSKTTCVQKHVNVSGTFARSFEKNAASFLEKVGHNQASLNSGFW